MPIEDEKTVKGGAKVEETFQSQPLTGTDPSVFVQPPAPPEAGVEGPAAAPEDQGLPQSLAGAFGSTGSSDLFGFQAAGWANWQQATVDVLSWIAGNTRLITPSGHISNRLVQDIGAVATRFAGQPDLGMGLIRDIVDSNQYVGEQFVAPPPDAETTGSLFDPWAGISFGGGGGGVAPVYIPPDRRLVEDMVRGALVVRLGRADQGRLQFLTDQFMADHRAAWESPESGMDPRASMIEAIRNQSDYKRIHRLRPDAVDEEKWVSDRFSLGIRAGLSPEEAEQFSINMAQIGGSTEDAQRAGQVQTFAAGRKTQELRGQFLAGARSMFRRVR